MGRKARIEGASGSTERVKATIAKAGAEILAEEREKQNATFGISGMQEWQVWDENDAAILARIVETFKAQHPERWEAIRLCPTWHGFDEMIACLHSS